ncbi:hypothetical protein REPUB_Repub08aG0140000 [Reevesia pubescens]
MVGKAAQSVAKAVGEYQYPWREKLAKYQVELSKGRKEMRSKMKGHKCDRIAVEKRENTADLVLKMPEMLLDYKKRRWKKKMTEEEKKKFYSTYYFFTQLLFTPINQIYFFSSPHSKLKIDRNILTPPLKIKNRSEYPYTLSFLHAPKFVTASFSLQLS